MKKLAAILILTLLSGLIARATPDRFLIQFRGVITSITNSAIRFKVRETNLVTTNGNLLVYEIDSLPDFPLQSLNLIETDSTGTNFVRENCHSDDNAVDHTRRIVTFDIHDSPATGFVDNVGGIPPFNGRIIATGRGTPRRGPLKKIRFKVFGVWNSSDNFFFKGTITGVRLP